MAEALRMALVVADRMFSPGIALLHTVAGREGVEAHLSCWLYRWSPRP